MPRFLKFFISTYLYTYEWDFNLQFQYDFPVGYGVDDLALGKITLIRRQGGQRRQSRVIVHVEGEGLEAPI